MSEKSRKKRSSEEGGKEREGNRTRATFLAQV